MQFMFYFVCFTVFVLGTIIGSFINCVIYRLHIKKTFLRSRSFCPKCKKPIIWYDNIPILSFLLLRAKCRHCHKPISIQYPIVEFATGILFLIILLVQIDDNSGYFIFSSLDIFYIFRNWIFTAFLVVLFTYDLKYYLILDRVSLPAMVIALAFNIPLALTASAPLKNIGFLFLSAIIFGGFFLLQFIFSKGKWVGGGDIRLGALAGFMLGWPNALVALMLAYILGMFIALYLIAAKKKTMKSAIPFGVFLAPSVFIALLWGHQIVHWYLNLTFY